MEFVSFLQEENLSHIMQKLDPPLKRYLLGSRPAWSGRSTLYQHYTQLTADLVQTVLHAGGYMTDHGKPTPLAVERGLVAACENKVLWSTSQVHEVLLEAGLKVERAAVNQDVTIDLDKEPQWANLGTVGTYFSVSATVVGRWLDELGFREDGEPTSDALREGLAVHYEMNAGGKKTRKVTHWNLDLVKLALVENGHELNFDYEGSLKGRGRNSDVSVDTLESRQKEFAREFSKLFKDASTRSQCKRLVEGTPKPVIVGAETLLRKPGFITRGEYLKF